MEVKNRLTQYLSYKGIGQVSFANIAGLSRGYVNNIVNSIGPIAQSKIAKSFPDLNIDWLITGKGNMLKEESVSTNSENTNQQSDDMTIQKLLEALERKDKQINALLEQNSNLTAIISRFSGVSPLDDRISPPHTISVNTQDSER
jgi:hypothetical protein